MSASLKSGPSCSKHNLLIQDLTTFSNKNNVVSDKYLNIFMFVDMIDMFLSGKSRDN